MTVTPVEWVVSASALILVVLLLRSLLGKRISARFRYGLWAVVVLRLLVPVSLELSVPQLPSWTPPKTMQEENIYLLPVSVIPQEQSGVQIAEDGALRDANSFGYPQLSHDGEWVVRYAEKISLMELLKAVWMIGAVIFAAFLLGTNLHFQARLRRIRRPLEGMNAPVPVYTAPALPSPCLAGLLRPAVYVTEEAAANPVMLRHVLVHELTHYNHRDHLWSVLRGLALAVHWWNPLVWAAVVYSRRDGEMACDEGALARLGDGERTAYGETLLALVTAKARPADLLSFATTMAGGKRSLKHRIQQIACKPKQLVSAFIAVTILISASALVAFGQADDAEALTTREDTNKEAPSVSVSRPDDAWQTAEITLTEDGVPHIDYQYGNTMEFLDGDPIPAPKEWANQDLAGRNKAKYLEYAPDVWAKLVSPNEGWLAACYGHGVAGADTYVYKTKDGGMTWTEAAMPGTGWHISDVGFISKDRLIVAQRLFDGAPCRITKDGGETWEEVELPEGQVLSIRIVSRDHISLFVGAHESGPAAYVMTSYDDGDSWIVDSLEDVEAMQADLTHDGTPEKLCVTGSDQRMGVYCNDSGSFIWEDDAFTAHVGWKAIFLCRREGEDYLLCYTPWMGGGLCEYRYQLFYLTAEGEEVTVQQNEVEFDLIFDLDYADRHHYDPQEIAVFMGEINTLLEESSLLVNTDQNLEYTFRKEGRWYDSLWWLGDDRDENLSLLENLVNYGSYAQDHPDDVWSPLADLLSGLTTEDIRQFRWDEAELVRCLRAAERGSRYYTWESTTDACLGNRDIAVQSDILSVALSDGSELELYDLESGQVLIILGTEEKAVSAFYDAPELYRFMQNIFHSLY